MPLGVAKANRMLKKYGSKYKNHVFINHVIKEFGHKIDALGVENIPASGPVTLVANHPGGADVVATISAIAQKRADHVILANELICVEPVVDLVLPVNMLAKSNKLNMDSVHQAYKDGKVVVFYAAGKNSRHNEEGELRDRKWRPTFIDFALEYNTPITVLKIGGSNAKLFYKVSRFREKRPKLKKVPLENIFQLRELVHPKKDAIPLIFSEPIGNEYIKSKIGSGDIREKRDFAEQLYNFLYRMDGDHLKFEE